MISNLFMNGKQQSQQKEAQNDIRFAQTPSLALRQGLLPQNLPLAADTFTLNSSVNKASRPMFSGADKSKSKIKPLDFRLLLTMLSVLSASVPALAQTAPTAPLLESAQVTQQLQQLKVEQAEQRKHSELKIMFEAGTITQYGGTQEINGKNYHYLYGNDGPVTLFENSENETAHEFLYRLLEPQQARQVQVNSSDNAVRMFDFSGSVTIIQPPPLTVVNAPVAPERIIQSLNTADQGEMIEDHVALKEMAQKGELTWYDGIEVRGGERVHVFYGGEGQKIVSPLALQGGNGRDFDFLRQLDEGSPHLLQGESSPTINDDSRMYEWAREGKITRHYSNIIKTKDDGDFHLFRYEVGGDIRKIRFPVLVNPSMDKIFVDNMLYSSDGRLKQTEAPDFRTEGAQTVSEQDLVNYTEDHRLLPETKLITSPNSQILEFIYGRPDNDPNKDRRNRIFDPANTKVLHYQLKNGGSAEIDALLAKLSRHSNVTFKNPASVIQGGGSSGYLVPHTGGPGFSELPGDYSRDALKTGNKLTDYASLAGWSLVILVLLGFVIRRSIDNRKRNEAEIKIMEDGGSVPGKGGKTALGGSGGKEDGKINYDMDFIPKIYKGSSKKSFADIAGQERPVENIKEELEIIKERKTLRLSYLNISSRLERLNAIIDFRKVGDSTDGKAKYIDLKTNLNANLIKLDIEPNSQTLDDDLQAKKVELEAEVQKLVDASEALGKQDGYIMTGPPGTGKTLLASIIASEVGIPVITTNGGDFRTEYQGSGSSRIKSMFKQIRKAEKDHGMAILFIDEFDGIGGKAQGGNSDNQLLSTMKTEMESIENLLDEIPPNIIIIGATNSRDLIDASLLRPGRLGTELKMENPSSWQARLEILELYFKKMKLKIKGGAEEATKVLTLVAKQAGNDTSPATLEKYLVQGGKLRKQQLKIPIQAALLKAQEKGQLKGTESEIRERYDQHLKDRNESVDEKDAKFSPEESTEIVNQFELLESIKASASHDKLGDVSSVSEEILTNAIKDTDMGEVSPKEEWPTEKEHVQVMRHELGHGLANFLAGWTISDMSAQPRKGGAMGFVRGNPDGSDFSEKLPQLGQYLNRLFTFMMGRAMEEAYYGHLGITPGASNDRDQALGAIKQMLHSGMIDGHHTVYKSADAELTDRDKVRQQLMMDTLMKSTLKMATYVKEHHSDKMDAIIAELRSEENINRDLGEKGAMDLMEKHFGFPKVLADRLDKSYKPDFWKVPEQILNDYLNNDVSWRELTAHESPVLLELKDKDKKPV